MNVETSYTLHHDCKLNPILLWIILKSDTLKYSVGLNIKYSIQIHHLSYIGTRSNDGPRYSWDYMMGQNERNYERGDDICYEL